MSARINRIALFLGSSGLGVLVADLFGTTVPDNTGMQVFYVLAIVGALVWRNLPDQDGKPGPDVLQGGRFDWRAFFRNLRGSLGLGVLAFTVAACGATAYGARVCNPAYSDEPGDCFVVQGEAGRRGSTIEIVEVPDSSVSVEAWVEQGPAYAFGSASFDPAEGSGEATGCVGVPFFERCVSAPDAGAGDAE